MINVRFLSSLLMLGLAASAMAADTTSVTYANPPLTTFTEDKPAFIYFKDGTFTRDGKMKINVDITLDGEIPNALTDRKVIYFIGFDVDNNGSTGKSSLTFPGFGTDLSVWFTKEEKETRFMPFSGSLVYKGKHIDIKVSKLKVSGDKITCELSSEIFGVYDSLRVYVQSQQEFTSHNLITGEQWVDQLPRKGAMTLGKAK